MGPLTMLILSLGGLCLADFAMGRLTPSSLALVLLRIILWLTVFGSVCSVVAEATEELTDFLKSRRAR